MFLISLTTATCSGRERPGVPSNKRYESGARWKPTNLSSAIEAGGIAS